MSPVMGLVCVSVLWSLLVLAWAQDSSPSSSSSSSPPSSSPSPSPSPSPSFFPCSSMVQGCSTGRSPCGTCSPHITSGCSWTVENPDPTKYTLYVRFKHHAAACHAYAPILLPLDHYLANQSCVAPPDPETVDLCRPRPSEPHPFLQFDKNFVQLCLTTAPASTAPPGSAHD
ncbi:hypothetical protein COCON_G00000020, partial [Conger conger]